MMQYVSKRWSFVATKELDNTDRPLPQLEEGWWKVEPLLKRPQKNAEALHQRRRIGTRRAEQSDCITSRPAELDMHPQECENAEQFAHNSKIRQENAAQTEGIVGRHCRCRWSIESTYVCVRGTEYINRVGAQRVLGSTTPV
jgi:hypothetical protein